MVALNVQQFRTKTLQLEVLNNMCKPYYKFTTLIVAIAFSLLSATAGLAQTPGTAPLGSSAFSKSSGITSLDPTVTLSGFISTSIDGCATLSTLCTTSVEKPAGATVRAAYLAAATVPGRQLADGSMSLEGTVLEWDQVVANTSFGFGYPYNYWADVTDIVKPVVDAAAAGIVDVTVGETESSITDGSLLVVVFDDPNATSVQTVVLLFGAQAITGDTFSIGLADPFDDATQDVLMSLGISFSYQLGTQQDSRIDVNGVRMSSAAGGQDECQDSATFSCGNGGLFTVGGLGDSDDTPADPNQRGNSVRNDDEYYRLDDFLTDGATGITVSTLNESNDDNILFAAFVIKGTAAVVGEGITLGPTDSTNPVGTDHTVTAKVQDNSGAPRENVDVDFEIISGPNTGLTGSATTNASGEADFTWSSATAGLDVVVARFTDSQQVLKTSNEARKRWVEDDPEEGIVLGPANATNPLNTDHTVTAVVSAGAEKLAGVTVDFEITAGPNAGLTGQSVTDANGEATFTWSSAFEGTDVVVARFMNSDQELITSNVANKTWVRTSDCVDPSWDGSVTYNDDMAYLTIHVPGGVVEAELYNTNNLSSLGIFDESFNDITGDFTVVGSGGDVKYTYNGTDPAPEVINMKIAANAEGPSRFFVRVSNNCTTVDIDPVINVDVETEVADQFVVFQNYPNPFRTSTTISFQIATADQVNVSVYDVLGKRVRTIVSEEMVSGQHHVQWDGRTDSGDPASSGIYLYRVETGKYSKTHSMTLLK